MHENLEVMRKVGISANPLLLLGITGLGIVMGVGSVAALAALHSPFADHASTAALSRSIGHPWLSLLLSMVIGLPSIIRYKFSLRKYRELHIESAIFTRAEKRRRPVFKPFVIDCLFVVGSPAVAAYLAYWLQIACLPAFWGPFILYFLAYPEQKEIYSAAQERLAEMR